MTNYFWSLGSFEFLNKSKQQRIKKKLFQDYLNKKFYNLSYCQISMSLLENQMESATPNQKEILVSLIEAAEREIRMVEQKRMFAAGIDSSTLTKSEKLEQEIYYVRAEISNYLKIAAELGMSNLGLIKDNYQRYTGESLPENPAD